MDLDREFDRRIAAIHGLDRDGGIDGQISGVSDSVDVRNAELNAMTDVYLGKNYDPAKRKRIEDLQIDGRRQQAELALRLQLGQLSSDEYLKEVNAVIEGTFEKCEEVIGSEDFCKLFGAPRSELVGLIDPQIFSEAVKRTTVPPERNPCQPLK